MIEYYQANSTLYFLVHFFPLPYHHNSYLGNQAVKIISKYYAKNTKQQIAAIYSWIDVVFANQPAFYNEATANNTNIEIIQNFATLAEKAVGVPTSFYVTEMEDYMTDSSLRVDFKYGISRGVYGTPSFYLNGVFVNVQGTNTFEQWRALIDPLVPDSN